MHFRVCLEPARLVKMASMRSFPLVVVACLLCWLAPVSGWAQQLQCNPCSHAFGNVQIGKSSSYSFKLTNTGNKTVDVLSKSKQGPAFSFGHFPLPVTIQPGASILLPVIFTPTAKGSTDGILTIASNALNSPLSMHVAGTGVAPELQCNPCSHAFGNVQIGKSSSYSFKLTNTGNKTVDVLSKSKQGAAFSFGHFPLPVTIQPGASILLPVIFTPTAKGWTDGTLTIASNALNSPLHMHVAGTGVAPELQCNPCSHAFGNVQIGKSSSYSFKLTNTGNKTVDVLSKSKQGAAFSFGHFPLPVTLLPGASILLPVIFTPTAKGSTAGILTIASNALNSPLYMHVAGTGVAPELQCNPCSHAFGNVQIGKSSSYSFKLTNTGNKTVDVFSKSKQGSAFSFGHFPLPVTIQPGASILLPVIFTPTAK